MDTQQDTSTPTTRAIDRFVFENARAMSTMQFHKARSSARKRISIILFSDYAGAIHQYTERFAKPASISRSKFPGNEEKGSSFVDARIWEKGEEKGGIKSQHTLRISMMINRRARPAWNYSRNKIASIIM